MALTLLEASKLHASNGEFRKAGITMAFAESSPLLGAMPIVNIQGNAYTWNVESVLSTASYRAVNEDYTAGEGHFEVRTEALKILGGTIQVDRAIVQTLGEDKRRAQEALKAKALAQKIAYELIEGSTDSNSKAIDGLRERFPKTHAQAVDNGSAALSMKALDEAIDGTSSPTHILMTREMRRNVTAYLRASGTAIQMLQDAFGRQIMAYNDLPILIADPVDVDSSYQALPTGTGSNNDEDSGETSVFVLSLGTEMLHMVQNGGLQTDDLGLNDEGTKFGTLCEWIAGMADEHPRCVSRLTDITAASTATA